MIAREALYRALVTKLIAANGVFQDRVFKDIAEAGTPYPYAVFSWAGGGDDNARKWKKSANIVIQVKCVSDRSLQSLQGASQIDAALDDQGYQDVLPSALDTTAQIHGWRITTVTADGDVTLTETFENTKSLYHEGKTYRFIMEEV